MNRLFPRGALGAAACLILSAPALAHATLAVTEAAPDAAYRGVVQIGHGCHGSPTTSVRVSVPDGLINVRPMPKPGWSLAVTTGPYAKPYGLFGKTVTEGVKEVVWSGSSLPDAFYDEFVFMARVGAEVPSGTALPVPVVQECESGARRWVEVAEVGQDRRALKEPAPVIRVAAKAEAAIRAGSLTIEAAWVRATPGGARVAGGYVRITNAGAAPDRLVGASFPIALRTEVHEMANEGGVMKMRELEAGLPIAPGATVELRPGGYHLMLTDLSGPAREGETLRGTLVFEKAGAVAVTFRVGGIGARAAPAAEDHSRH